MKTVDSVEPVTSLQSDSVENARAKKFNIKTYRKKNMTKLIGNNLNENDYMTVMRGKARAGRMANQSSISPDSMTTTSNMVILSELGQHAIPQSSQNSKFVDKDGKSLRPRQKKSKRSKKSTD